MSKIVVLTCAAILIAALVPAQPSQSASVSSNNSGDHDIYQNLRISSLRALPRDIGLSLSEKDSIVYGVVMDLDIDGNTATVAAYMSGEASLYLSTGGGIVGGGAHAKVASAAKRFVALAQAQIIGRTIVTKYPAPSNGEVIFYIISTKGVYAVKGNEDALSRGEGALSDLFNSGQEVLSNLSEIK